MVHSKVHAGSLTPAWTDLRWNMGKNKAGVAWDDRCQQSFDDLKHPCTMAPILAYANFTRPFKLHTNGCRSGLGAVLYQTCDYGTDAVMAYTSRSLTKAKSHYPAPNWSFLPSSGLWLRNSMNTIIPWPMSWQQPSWMLWVTDGWPAWPITTFNCIIGQRRLISMQMPCQGSPGQSACLQPQTASYRLLWQQCKLCRRLPSKAPWAPLKHIAAICTSWTQQRTVHRLLACP